MAVHVEPSGDGDAIRVVTLDRPERRNALDHATLEALLGALGDLPAATRAVVLTGAGGFFCAGADLTTVEDEGFVALLRSVLQAMRSVPVPVLAAIEGPALGAGTQLALAADLRVATADVSFGIPAAKLGLTVDQWTVDQLVVAAGDGPARGLLLGVEVLRGSDLHRTGFVHRLVEPGSALDAALAWATELADLAPLTLAAHKLMLAASTGVVGAAEAAAARDRAWASADLQEGLAAFQARRRPDFTGR
ncbi:MAG TPA: enoyl-CoA hydratase-related protein [Acidimicrobiales bacterium]|jgi:enoyl-CoA hydratase|nr:enoyl-CoA hydratase-related protein [Acidimicrobiales bacterium]